MFVVRSKSGMVFTSTEWGENNGKELEYKTRAEAEKEIEIYQQSFRDQEFFIHELNAVGRPPLGITKKVSLTLSEENWDWLDEKAEGNRSKLLREIVWNALGNESEWDNYACLGYAILGAKQVGLNDEQTKKLVRSIYSEFDMVGVDKANEIYRESDY